MFTASYQTDVDDLQGKSDRALMRELPQEEREQIQVGNFISYQDF
jgi:hypothetical protein